MRLARASALLVAILACAWFVISERQAVDTQRATALLASNRPLSAADAARARSLLRSARFLNPDITVRLLAARIETLRGDSAGAVRSITPLLRQEPMNLAVWVALAQASLHGSRRELLYAVNQIGRLDPKG